MTSVESNSDDGAGGSTQPAEHVRQLWWAECTVCGTTSFGGSVTMFDSRVEMWALLEDDEHGWTRRDDGRVLCRIHSHVADCDRDGHPVTSWRAHPIENTLEWRYCERCGAQFEQRIIRR